MGVLFWGGWNDSVVALRWMVGAECWVGVRCCAGLVLADDARFSLLALEASAAPGRVKMVATRSEAEMERAWGGAADWGW